MPPEYKATNMLHTVIPAGEASIAALRNEDLIAMRQEYTGLLDDMQSSQRYLNGAKYLTTIGEKSKTDDPHW